MCIPAFDRLKAVVYVYAPASAGFPRRFQLLGYFLGFYQSNVARTADCDLP